MTDNNSEFPANTIDRDFMEFMHRGDDFFKIELLRQAKSWYKKALLLNINSDEAKAQVAECERLLAFENKVVYILLSIASVFLLVYVVFFH
jgi:hypothetical protein